MTTLKQLRVVIASPSDVKEERDALDRVIQRVNYNTAEGLGLILKLVRWETESDPGFHVKGPQALIDPVLNIEDRDILIGIFWKRFGTPTNESGKTGTEHEFSKAYEAWRRKKRPHIMLYFNQKQYFLTTVEESKQLTACKFTYLNTGLLLYHTLDFDVVDRWDHELSRMNLGKVGARLTSSLPSLSLLRSCYHS